jgi:hypothetical protein
MHNLLLAGNTMAGMNARLGNCPCVPCRVAGGRQTTKSQHHNHRALASHKRLGFTTFHALIFNHISWSNKTITSTRPPFRPSTPWCCSTQSQPASHILSPASKTCEPVSSSPRHQTGLQWLGSPAGSTWELVQWTWPHCNLLASESFNV